MAGVSESIPSAGPEIIRDLVKRLPGKPGVYRMIDAKGDVIYVGKARNLRNRVPNYTRTRRPHQPHRGDDRAHRQHGIRHHRDGSRGAAARSQSDQEAQAALQCHAARRQVLSLYPDRQGPSGRRSSPSIAARRARKGSYYGPFASAGAVNRTINTLQKAFLLRSCNDSVFENRTRPCLLYQIKRCSAPCVG